MVVLDGYQSHPADGFLACLYQLTGVEPCPVALGPIDSLHDVPTPIRLAGQGYPPRNHIPHTVPGSADDVEYCSSVEYAAQHKTAWPVLPERLRLAAVLTPMVWQARKLVLVAVPGDTYES